MNGDREVVVVIVVSKGKTLTWLDDCRIPYQSEEDKAESSGFHDRGNGEGLLRYRQNNEKLGYDKLLKNPLEDNPPNEKGRFPANLLVSDDILNDGKITKSSGGQTRTQFHKDSNNFNQGVYAPRKITNEDPGYGDTGSYSRYFDLDKWAQKNLTLNTKHKNKKRKDKPMLLLGDSLTILKDINNETIDLIVTDPPYGIEFMGKDWDKALPSIDIWKECYRVLKTGKLAFVMCSPRQDVLSRMIISLEDAGFRTNYTSIYWTYSSGFPKALNLEKALCKRYAQTSQSQVCDLWKAIIHSSKCIQENGDGWTLQDMLASLEQGTQYEVYAHTRSQSEGRKIPERQFKSSMEGWSLLQKQEGQVWTCQICKVPIGVYFNGTQRRLCYGAQIDNGSVNWQSIDENGMCASYQSSDIGQSFRESNVICDECITQKVRDSGYVGAYSGVQVKPAVEVILVVSKGKTLTWLDDCRIPYQNESDKFESHEATGLAKDKFFYNGEQNIITKSPNEKGRFPANLLVSDDVLNDGSIHKSGKFADHHIIDSAKTRNCYGKYNNVTADKQISHGDSGSYSRYFSLDSWAKTLPFIITPKPSKSEKGEFNRHPTVKSIKLFSYLITMGSREGDIILDPFCGSGTTLIAADNLARKYIGIEINQEYLEIAKHRLLPHVYQTKLVPLISEESV